MTRNYFFCRAVQPTNTYIRQRRQTYFALVVINIMPYHKKICTLVQSCMLVLLMPCVASALPGLNCETLRAVWDATGCCAETSGNTPLTSIQHIYKIQQRLTQGFGFPASASPEANIHTLMRYQGTSDNVNYPTGWNSN